MYIFLYSTLNNDNCNFIIINKIFELINNFDNKVIMKLIFLDLLNNKKIKINFLNYLKILINNFYLLKKKYLKNYRFKRH